MPTDPSYFNFVIEQLSSVMPAINSRPMFGGVGIYSHGLFFALIASDILYFKVNDETRPVYEALGMRRFGKNYYEVPIAVLEDSEVLSQWARKAVAAALKKGRTINDHSFNPMI
jgi:DNA transformation protein and related proteins